MADAGRGADPGAALIHPLPPDADPWRDTAETGPGGALWGVLDCARDRSLYPEIEALDEDAICLFRQVKPEVIRAAPHLVRLREGSRLLERWRSEGWGAAWGMLFRSEADRDTLFRELRRHMDVELPDGRRVLYRFWDPRVGML